MHSKTRIPNSLASPTALVSVLNRTGKLSLFPVVLLMGALLASNAFAQTLKLQFKFEDAGTTTADSVAGVPLNMVNSSGTATDLHGAVGTGVAGNGKALDLTSSAANGTGNIVSTVNNSGLGFGSIGSWTVTEWVKPNGSAPNLARFFILGANGTTDVNNNANSFAFAAKNTTTSCQVYINTVERGSVEQTLVPPLPLGGWTFIAYTYDGTTLSLYSGSDTTSVTFLGSASYPGLSINFSTAGSLFLGNRSSNGRAFKGYIDDTRFYTGAANASFLETVRLQALPVAAGATTFSPLSPVYVGTTVTIRSAVTGGTAPYTYDWQASSDGVNYSTDLGSGNGDGTYTLNTTGMGGTTTYYRLVVHDSVSPGTLVTNLAAALFVSSTPLPPTVVGDTTVTPSTVLLGGSTTASAVISGTAPIAYQWQYSATNDGTGLVNVPGATNSTYVISNAQYTNTGYYRLTASNASGGTNTSFARLTVQTPVVISTGAAGVQPTIATLGSGAYNISQLSSVGDVNFPDANGLNYFDNNGTPPGQTFTTGNNPTGYALGDLYYLCGGPVINNGSHTAGTVYTLRLYSMTNAFAGTATLLSTYTNQNTAPAIANNTWAHWTGLTNLLAPNSVYAYTISAGSGYMHLGNCSNSPAPYTGGQLVMLPAAGGAGTFGTGAATNTSATFLLPVVPAGYPWAEDLTMSVTNGSTVTAGTQVGAAVSAIGSGIRYFWQIDGVVQPNSNPNLTTYNIDTTTLTPGTHSISVLVSNNLDVSASPSLTLNVVAANILSVSLSPTNSATSPVYAGTPVALSSTVQGNNLTYYWQTDGGNGNWGNIPNSNTNLLVIDTSAMTAGTYQYQLMVSNASGTVTSSQLTLNLAAASGPQLVSGATVTPPVVIVGNTATFAASFVGSQPMSYQWQHAGTNIPGATATTFTLTNAQLADAGNYVLKAFNNPPGLGAQQSSSAPAYLYVVAAPETNTSVAKITDGGTSPYVGTYDVAQTTDSQIAPPGRNYYVDNSTPPGQIFTTGSTPPPAMSAFPLNYVYFKHDASVGSTANTTAQAYTLRVYKMLDGTNAQLLTTYITTNTVAFTAGDWVRVDGLTNKLAPNTTYAISLARNTSGYWRMACTLYTSAGPNGQACLTPTLGGAMQLSSPDPTFGYYYDAAYVAGLTPPTAPVELTPMTLVPSSVYAGQGPVVMTAAFNGSQPISYQWQVDTGSGYVKIPGATNSTYTIPVAALTNAGTYQCLASNAMSAGIPTPSTAQTLTVKAAPTTSFVANFAYWNTHPGAASPGYNGPGVIGTGTAWNRPVPGTATADFNGTPATLCQNPPSAVADDGYSDLGSLTLSAYATKTDDYYWYSAVPSGEITLLDTFMDNQSTNALPFAISNAFNGCYNLVLFAENGRNTSARTTFTVNGLSQTLTNTSASLNKFVQGNNYVVFYNIAVTNGTIAGTWSNPSGSTSAALNGAQLQMAYSAENPQMFFASQPVDVTVSVGRPASVSVLAQGPGTNWLPGPVFYQWYESNNNPVAGATNNTYAPDTSVAFTKTYYCVATNLTGLSITSASATITVFQPDTLVWLGSAGETWDVNNTANWNDVSIMSSPAVYADPGVVRFDDSASSFTVSNAATVAPSSVTVSNSANNYVFYGSGTISGIASLTKTGNGTLTISNNQAYTGGTIVDGGTLVLAKGGAAGTLNGTLTANPGTSIRLTAGDALGYSGNHVTVLNLNGATMDNATANNESYATTWNLTGGTMTSSGGGAYNISPADGYSINSLATNVPSVISGNIAMRNAGLTIATAQGTVPSGIDLSISGRISDAGGATLTKTGNGTLSLSGTNTFNGDIHINAGKLRIDGSGSLNSGNYTAHLFINGTDFSYNSSANQALGAISGSGTLTMNGNGTLTLNGSSDYTNTTTVNAGTLAGTGNVGGALIVNSGATLAPGSAGVGTLTVNGNVTLNAGSTSLFEVDGSTSANDKVVLAAAVTYGGALKIVPSGTFTAGQQFTLFSGAGAASASNFASIQGDPGNGNYFTFTNGVLSVAAAGPSGSRQLTNVVSGSTMTLSWGAGWRLQAQTNNLAKGLGTNWVYVTDGSQTSTNIVVDKSSPAVFYRLTYP